MSAKWDAYHALDQRTLEFFHNWAIVNTYYCNPKGIPYDEHFGNHFGTLGKAFLGSTGADTAATSLSCLLSWYGSYDNRPIELQPAMPEYDMPAQPYADPYGIGWYQHQFTDIPLYAMNYPRPAYKARRSYWTGAPRRRLNLPT